MSVRRARLRRFAIVVCAAWALLFCGLGAYEVAKNEVGYFLALSLPVGTVVLGDQATLPDGKVVKLPRPIDVRDLPPGAIAWNDESGVVELQPRTGLLAAILLVPFSCWLALEALVLAGRWILHGKERGST